MKVLVTGGAGFIGSHLVDKLIAKGYEVICIDNLLTGSEENIAHLKANPKFKFLNLDVTENLPNDLEADQVYHLASPASPNHQSPKSYHQRPFETMQVNSTGTWKLAEFAQERKAKFLFASTSEVYGDPQEHPQKESYTGNVSTTGPRSVYDESKRFGETITASFFRHQGLDGRIVRIFNTYGSRMALDDGRVMVEFVKAALQSKPLIIFGTGAQTRSFCEVSDLVKGLILAMETTDTTGEVYNLGNPDEYTIMDLAEKIKKMIGSSSQIKFNHPLPEGDPQRRCPDISKARQKLLWEPKISLDEGLPKFIEDVKSKL